MTGYGRKEVDSRRIHLTVEIRSVNNRFIDVQVKVPAVLFGALEPRIKKAVQERCSRGRFDVFIAGAGTARARAGSSSTRRCSVSILQVMKGIKKRYRAGRRPRPRTGSGIPGAGHRGRGKRGYRDGLGCCSEGSARRTGRTGPMRTEEGSALVADMVRRLDMIEQLCRTVQELSPQTVEQARKRMSETLARLLNEQPDPVRVWPRKWRSWRNGPMSPKK